MRTVCANNTVCADNINNNNVRLLHQFRHLDNSEIDESTQISNTTCKTCAKEFISFTELYKHQAKPCHFEDNLEKNPDGKLIMKEPIKVIFPKHHLDHIQDYLKHADMQVQEEDNNSVFVVWDKFLKEHLAKKLYFAHISRYNIEEWYPKIKDLEGSLSCSLTAPTVFFPFSDDDLKFIQKLYSRRALGMTLVQLSRVEMSQLTSLESRISSVMDPNKRYFVRLSTRSPKDTVKSASSSNHLSSADRLKSKYKQLEVSNSQQIVEILSKSARIFADISNYFVYRTLGSPSGTLNLILREWQEIPYDREFRCFVHNKLLTAISQYHCYDIFPHLLDVEIVSKIRENIMKFHGLVKETIPMTSYVMDVVLMDDNTQTVHIIEVNPFGAEMSSGAGLFNWDTDSDILYGNNDETIPQIRILKENLSSNG